MSNVSMQNKFNKYFYIKEVNTKSSFAGVRIEITKDRHSINVELSLLKYKNNKPFWHEFYCCYDVNRGRQIQHITGKCELLSDNTVLKLFKLFVNDKDAMIILKTNLQDVLKRYSEFDVAYWNNFNATQKFYKNIINIIDTTYTVDKMEQKQKRLF